MWFEKRDESTQVITDALMTPAYEHAPPKLGIIIFNCYENPVVKWTLSTTPLQNIVCYDKC